MLIDTDVAIHWRDGEPGVYARIAALSAIPAISVVTLVELRAGAADDRSSAGVRQALLDRLLLSVPVLPFAAAEAAAYGVIIAATGHDRRRVLDRMIAAQAIVVGVPLVTMNGRNFRGIPGLELVIWPAP